MKPDPEYLRRHYESLNDEALLAVDRDDLVETAQTLYDAELRRRRLERDRDIPVSELSSAAFEEGLDRVQPQFHEGDGDAPNWLHEAAEAYGVYASPGTVINDGLTDATSALEAAGIPCHVDFQDEPEHIVQASTRLRLLVPGDLAIQATSTIEREFSNPEFESVWKGYLESLSNEEFSRVNPEIVLCGLFDRVNRVMKTFEAECARRRIRPFLSRNNL
jgi:hypothetical protein